MNLPVVAINLSAKQAVTAVLCAGFQIGASLAVVVATLDIESIIPSGIIFAPFGLFLTSLGRRSDVHSLAALGLATTCLCLALLLLINWMRWGPQQAAAPVSILLLIYELITMPLGWLAWHTLLMPAGRPFAVMHTFSLRQLLGIVAGCSIALATAKVALNSGASTLTSIAIGCSVMTVLGLVGVWLSVSSRVNEKATHNEVQES